MPDTIYTNVPNKRTMTMRAITFPLKLRYVGQVRNDHRRLVNQDVRCVGTVLGDTKAVHTLMEDDLINTWLCQQLSKNVSLEHEAIQGLLNTKKVVHGALTMDETK